MLDKINTGPKTELGMMDITRPPQMLQADKLYTKLTIRHGKSSSNVLDFMTNLQTAITSTPRSKADTVWTRIEQKINASQKIVTKPDNQETKLAIAASLFYNATNTLDAGDSAADVQNIKTLFKDTQSHIEKNFYPDISISSRRVLDRIFKTVSSRIEAVATRFNARIESGEIAGTAIS